MACIWHFFRANYSKTAQVMSLNSNRTYIEQPGRVRSTKFNGRGKTSEKCILKYTKKINDCNLVRINMN